MSQISVLKQKMLIIIHKCPFDVRTKMELGMYLLTYTAFFKKRITKNEQTILKIQKPTTKNS